MTGRFQAPTERRSDWTVLQRLDRAGGEGVEGEANSRMNVAADLRQARSIIEEAMKRLHALPEDDRPLDPSRAAKSLNEAFLVLDAAIDEIEA